MVFKTKQSMIDIDWIRERVRNNEYYFSKHGDQGRQNDNLSIAELEEAVLTGRILEQYADMGRGESCLVAGFSNNKSIHVVCGHRGDWLVIVTVYIPMPPKFKSPYERA